jgi:hypothetical protein
MPAAEPEPPAAANALHLDVPPAAERSWPERTPPRADPPPRFDPPDMFEPAPEAPQRAESGDDRPPAGRRRVRRELFADNGLRADKTEEGLPNRQAEDRAPDRSKFDPPPVAMGSNWWQDTEEPVRPEPPAAAVVQPLKTAVPPPAADLESARAKAGEIGDSLDYAASALQQSATLLAERMQIKQGLDREDVRGMRIAGCERPPGAEDDLRKLGGDVAQEALAALDAVVCFDNVLRRLEQMAEAEPLDEGWNDLLRTRISDTLYQVGQVRKTLGSYRVAAKKPVRSSDKHARPGGASGGGPDRPVPVGRRQV